MCLSMEQRGPYPPTASGASLNLDRLGIDGELCSKIRRRDYDVCSGLGKHPTAKAIYVRLSDCLRLTTSQAVKDQMSSY